MAEQCKECLFSKARIVPGSRAAQIIKDCKKNGTHFICHKASLQGSTACCRAFFDRDDGSCVTIRIAKVMNGVVFVDENMQRVGNGSQK